MVGRRSSAETDSGRGSDSPKPRKRRIRALPAKLIGRIPWMRRRYARRTLRSIQKFKDKRRPLPEGLQRIDRQLQRLPPNKRQEALEQMLEFGARQEELPSREMRRSAERQERQSGRGRGGLRPGTPGGARKQVRR